MLTDPYGHFGPRIYPQNQLNNLQAEQKESHTEIKIVKQYITINTHHAQINNTVYS